MACPSLALAQSFTVTDTNGQASVGKDQQSYNGAQLKQQYPVGYWGKTGESSQLTIELGQSNSFHLLDESEAKVEGESNPGSSWYRVVKLKVGTANINHNSGSGLKLECETPTAVCGAQGTVFAVTAEDGTYSVSSGHIRVSSPYEGSLILDHVIGGKVVYAPGKDNTYAHATDLSGTVTISGLKLTARSATFTVAKKRDASGETIVHIESGTLGGTPSGYYVPSSKGLVPNAAAVGLVVDYVNKAQAEAHYNTQLQSARAATRTAAQHGLVAGALAGRLDAAAKAADDARQLLFARSTIRAVNADTVNQIQNLSTH